MFLKYIALIVVLFSFGSSLAGQEVYTPLATMKGRSFTIQDLPAEVRSAWQKLPTTLVKARKDLLEMQIDNLLLLQEANKRSVGVAALVETEVHKKVPDPDEKTIKDLYEANKASFQGATLSELRPRLISYLRLEPVKKARDAFLKKLRGSARIEHVTDINTDKPSLNAVIVNVNDEPVTFAMYKRKNGLPLYEYEANVFDQLDSALKLVVDAAIYQEEARSLGIPVNRLIANEITGKMEMYSAAQHKKLEKALKKRLYLKYRTKYFVTAPKPYKQKVSADDDPFIGKANARVTVVIFADYECPACAGVHPVIKSLVKKYGDPVRLVYRDFPLTKTHEYAMPAAKAAYAANKQGKFFEYTEVLYANQIALDTASLSKYAKDLGLNTETFLADMNSPEALAEIEKDISDASEYGVAGTPSIFVNGYKIRTLSVQAFEEAIERALAGTL